mmetsp:Transcript_4466/g.18150  ORF Transcript_4466/g.18150 Transcript_4466/m.18150 type:complete len:392 (-) Transcript_4466:285-1460(-)
MLRVRVVVRGARGVVVVVVVLVRYDRGVDVLDDDVVVLEPLGDLHELGDVQFRSSRLRPERRQLVLEVRLVRGADRAHEVPLGRHAHAGGVLERRQVEHELRRRADQGRDSRVALVGERHLRRGELLGRSRSRRPRDPAERFGARGPSRGGVFELLEGFVDVVAEPSRVGLRVLEELLRPQRLVHLDDLRARDESFRFLDRHRQRVGLEGRIHRREHVVDELGDGGEVRRQNGRQRAQLRDVVRRDQSQRRRPPQFGRRRRRALVVVMMVRRSRPRSRRRRQGSTARDVRGERDFSLQREPPELQLHRAAIHFFDARGVAFHEGPELLAPRGDRRVEVDVREQGLQVLDRDVRFLELVLGEVGRFALRRLCRFRQCREALLDLPRRLDRAP